MLSARRACTIISEFQLYFAKEMTIVTSRL